MSVDLKPGNATVPMDERSDTPLLAATAITKDFFGSRTALALGVGTLGLIVGLLIDGVAPRSPVRPRFRLRRSPGSARRQPRASRRLITLTKRSAWPRRDSLWSATIARRSLRATL